MIPRPMCRPLIGHRGRTGPGHRGRVGLAEDALFVGFIIPGETAAVPGGVAASRGYVPAWSMMLLVVLAAVAGGLVWGSGCVLLGFVAGSSYEAAAKAVGQDITAVVLAAVVIALITGKIRESRDERLADGTPASGPAAGRAEP